MKQAVSAVIFIVIFGISIFGQEQKPTPETTGLGSGIGSGRGDGVGSGRVFPTENKADSPVKILSKPKALYTD